MRAGRGAAALVPVLMLATACGASSVGDTSAQPSAAASTAAASPAPSPAEISTAQAGQQYLRIVAPLNTSLAKLQAAAHTENLARLKAAAGEYVTAIRAFNRRMLAAQWPAAARPTVDKLVEASAGQLVAARHLATASDYDDANTAVDEMTAAKVSTYVELLRTQLALPPAK